MGCNFVNWLFVSHEQLWVAQQASSKHSSKHMKQVT
jgi:hypothetical protein